MTTSFATQRPCKTASETRNAGVSFANKLDSGELLSGTPTVVEVTTSALTLTNKAVNTSALTLDGQDVAIGEAVTFTVAGGSAGVRYHIRVNVDTDAGVTQTLYGDVYLEVITD